MPKMNRGVHGFVWAWTLVLTLLLVWLTQGAQGRNLWGAWEESSELRRPIYLERIYAADLFRTRANTWSNLAFIVVGLYAMGLSWRDVREEQRGGYLERTPALSLAFGVATCCLGMASGFFHASLTRFGQHVDVAAMYPPLLVMLAAGVGRWVPVLGVGLRRLPTWPWLMAGVILTSGLLYYFKWSMSSAQVLLWLIGSVTTVSLMAWFGSSRRLDGRWLLSSAALLALAIFCRQRDIAGRFSGPDAWTQGHALWHILTALSLGCLYAFYRSERDGSASLVTLNNSL
jgi:hypothetical protein